MTIHNQIKVNFKQIEVEKATKRHTDKFRHGLNRVIYGIDPDNMKGISLLKKEVDLIDGMLQKLDLTLHIRIPQGEYVYDSATKEYPEGLVYEDINSTIATIYKHVHRMSYGLNDENEPDPKIKPHEKQLCHDIIAKLNNHMVVNHPGYDAEGYLQGLDP